MFGTDFLIDQVGLKMSHWRLFALVFYFAATQLVWSSVSSSMSSMPSVSSIRHVTSRCLLHISLSARVSLEQTGVMLNKWGPSHEIIGTS